MLKFVLFLIFGYNKNTCRFFLFQINKKNTCWLFMCTTKGNAFYSDTFYLKKYLLLFLLYLVLFDLIPRTAAFNKRSAASRFHWNFTIAGYSADRAFAAEVSLWPSSVIALTDSTPRFPDEQYLLFWDCFGLLLTGSHRQRRQRTCWRYMQLSMITNNARFSYNEHLFVLYHIVLDLSRG